MAKKTKSNVEVNRQVLDRYLAPLKRRRGDNLGSYGTYSRRFINFAADRELTRALVEEFMADLEKEGKAPGSLAMVWGVLRTMFNRSRIPWPFDRGDAPGSTERRRALALAPNAVNRIIAAARADSFAPKEVAAVALVTIYGVRREEVTTLVRESFHMPERLIHFKTAKKGVPRLHLIPPEILPYIRNWKGSPRITIPQMEVLWYRLEEAAGVPRIPGVGWHSLRRTLNTELRRTVSEHSMELFMGWRVDSSSKKMSDRYVMLEYVGDGEAELQQPTYRTEIDKEIFAVHPFLAAWKESLAKDTGTGKKTKR